MAITSTGYDTTVDETAWGRLAPGYGTLTGVDGVNDFTVTLATPSTVQVSTGTAYGWGIRDTNGTPITITPTAPATGDRFDAVIIRRDWNTNTSTVAVVQGGTQRITPTLQVQPGNIAEQALALIQTSADGTVVISDDLRVIPASVGVASTEKGMTGPDGSRYVAAAGSATFEAGQRFTVLGGKAVPDWKAPVPEPKPNPTVAYGTQSVQTNQYGSAVITHNLGWTPDRVQFASRATSDSGMVTVYLSVAANSLNSKTFGITCKIRTATGWIPYQGTLTYVDWVAHKLEPTRAIPGTVEPPPPPDEPEPTPTAPAATPVTSPSTPTEVVPVDGGAGTATQTTVPQIPSDYTEPVATVSAVSSILATAAAEIGVKESPTGSNKVKYWLAEKPSWNGQPWCACFTAWVYRRNGISVNTVLSPNLTGSNPYYTPYLEAAAKAKGLWYTGVPRPGDMVIYGGSANTKAVHVEIVEKWLSDVGRVQTIGGNTSDGLNGSPNDGGGVFRNKRNPKSTSLPVRGYIKMPTTVPTSLRVRGPFPLPSGHWFGVADSTTTLDHNGVADNAMGVKEIQAEVGTAIDGIFGPQTQAAVKTWQAAHNRTQTGRIYEADWNVLAGIA